MCIRDRCPDGSILNLIVEVSGEARKDKAAKVATARTLFVPAVNNHGGFGLWAFVEVTDPWDAEGVIRAQWEREAFADAEGRALARLRDGLDLRSTPPRSRDELHER